MKTFNQINDKQWEGVILILELLYWYKLSRVLSFAGINFRDRQGPKLTFTSINFREWAHSKIQQV